MFHFCNLAKALGDENRARILMALRKYPLCVCQLTTLLGLAASTTSKHLSILRQAQLIECVKSSRFAYYQLPANPANESITQALQWVHECLKQSPRIIEDEELLNKILKIEKGTNMQLHLQEMQHLNHIHAQAGEDISQE